MLHPVPAGPLDSDLPDRRLVERISAGNEYALAELTRRHSRSLYFRAHQILGSVGTHEDLEEILGDTFFYVWQNSSAYNPDKGAVSTWLHWIMVGRALPKRRTLLRSQRLVDALTNRTVETGLEDGEFLEMSTAMDLQESHVFKLLNTLSRSEQEIVIRRYVHGQSLVDIARDLGISAGAARVRLYRSLKKLRDRAGWLLDECEGGPMEPT